MKLNINQEFVGLLSNDEEYEMYVESEISEAREDARKEGVKEGINIGVERGLLQGITKGSKESKQEIAKAMLKEKMDINLIAKVTKLSIEEIEQLKD